MDQQISWNNLPTSPVMTTNANISYIDLTSDPDSPVINACTSMGPTSVWASINPDPQSTNPRSFQNMNMNPSSSHTDSVASVNSQMLSRKRKDVNQGEGSSSRNVNVNTALRIGPTDESSNRNCRIRINRTDQQQRAQQINHSVMNLEPNNQNQNHNHFVPLNLSMSNSANTAASFNPHITMVMPQTTHHFLNPSSVTHPSMGNFMRVQEQVPAPLQLGSGQNIGSVPARNSGSLSATWREERLRRVADVISGIRESYVTRPESGVTPESVVRPESGVRLESGIRPDFSTTESRRRILAEHFRTAIARRGEHMNLESFRDALARRGGHTNLEDMLLPTHVILQRRTAELHDRHRDMRLDVDNMSYEELLALEERIGDVNTGLGEEKIMKSLKRRKYISLSEETFSDEPCCICQEAYVEEEDVGRLKCGHDFHTACIKKWLILKNMCPICKTSAS